MSDAPLPKRLVKASKFVAKHLRHTPEAIGLKVDEAGWAQVDELLRCARTAGMPLTRAELDAVVAEPTKRRYAYDASGQRILAVQGHSVPVKLGLEPSAPPPVLFHGTYPGAVDAIFREGLRPMARQQVHLSADVDTARAVGARRGRPTILAVDAAAMAKAGAVFYCAENGVWLTDHVAPRYLTWAG